MAKRIAVKDLHAGSIEATPINVEDWSSMWSEFNSDGNAEFWEAQECDKVSRGYGFC